MTEPTVSILLVEDNAGDARLVKEMLDEGIEFHPLPTIPDERN